MHPGGARRKGASGQVTNNGAKWQESEAGEGEDGKMQKDRGEERERSTGQSKKCIISTFLGEDTLRKN